jgi:hypothetical protein
MNIECYRYIIGQKEASELFKKLLVRKRDESNFYIMDCKQENKFMITGSVSIEDWKELNLEKNFLIRTNFESIITWPKGTEYLSMGPFFENSFLFYFGEEDKYYDQQEEYSKTQELPEDFNLN